MLSLDILLYLSKLGHLLLLHLWVGDIQKLLQMRMLLLTVLQLLPCPAQVLVASQDRDVVTTARLRQILLRTTRMVTKQPSHFLSEELKLSCFLEPSVDICRIAHVLQVASDLVY